MSHDGVFVTWTIPELQALFRARLRRLLCLEQQQAPRTLVRTQERLARQAGRLLRQRGAPDEPGYASVAG